MKKYQKPEIELLKLSSQEDILSTSGTVFPGIDDDGYIDTPDYPIGRRD